VATLLWQSAYTQIGAILLAGVAGFLLYRNQPILGKQSARPFPVSKSVGVSCLALFFGLLLFFPVLNNVTSSKWIALMDSFYRSGSLVFGGGHVVLPLLEQEIVPAGWMSEEQFLAGDGAAQAVPGPLFTFAAYLGAIIDGW